MKLSRFIFVRLPSARIRLSRSRGIGLMAGINFTAGVIAGPCLRSFEYIRA